MTGSVTDDAFLRVLTDSRLRAVVSELGAAGEALSVSELARRLESSDAISTEGVQSVEIALYHDWLPRLSELGFVSFDRESMVVALSDDFPQFEAAAASVEDALETLTD